MGQEICAIITDIKNIERELVHFFEDNVVIIPLNMDYWILDYFLENAKNFVEITDYINFLQSINIPPQSHRDNFEKEQLSITTLIKIISKHDLKNFILTYYSEWADIPDNFIYMAVINGNICHDSIFTELKDEDSETSYTEGSVEKYNKLLGLDPQWFGNQDRYFNYNTAEQKYRIENNL